MVHVIRNIRNQKKRGGGARADHTHRVGLDRPLADENIAQRQKKRARRIERRVKLRKFGNVHWLYF